MSNSRLLQVAGVVTATALGLKITSVATATILKQYWLITLLKGCR